MLHVVFSLGADRYAIKAGEIVELLPLAALKEIPLAPDYVAGLLNYRGQPAPVIDLCQLLQNRPCGRVLSTRIILVAYMTAGGDVEPLGLIAENVTETLERSPQDIQPTGVTVPEAVCLGGVYTEPTGVTQLITVRELLPDAVQAQLFATHLPPELSESPA